MNLGKSPREASKQENTHFFILDLALCTGKGISDPLRDDQEGSQEQCSECNPVHGKTTQTGFLNKARDSSVSFVAERKATHI